MTLYVFTRTGDEWTRQSERTVVEGAAGETFGGQVGLAGDVAVVGAQTGADSNGPHAGFAHVFERDGGSWTQRTKLAPGDVDAQDAFGVATALTDRTALVGAAYDDEIASSAGSAYVFQRADDGWTRQAKLTPESDSYIDNFGLSVAVAGDTALVGAPTVENPQDQTGSAYVFRREDGDWTRRAILTAEDGASVDRFGWNVALAGETALVAAVYDENANGSEAGSVYAFAPVDGSWSQVEKVVPEAGGPEAHDGSAVASTDSTAVVGASGEDTAEGTDAGATYVYGR